MMNNRELLVFTVATALMAGCSHAPLQADYGVATEHNQRAQTINPVAERADVPLATLDGQKSEKLLKGYRTDSGKAATSSIIDVSK